MDIRLAFQPLEVKIEKTKEIILEAERFYGREKIALLWTGGKDSTVLLHLIKSMYKENIPFMIITVDTAVIFNEVYDFIKRLQDEWGLEIITLKNEDAKSVIESNKGREECCYLLRTKVLEDGIKKYGVRALMTAIRWDEQSSYTDEKYFSEEGDHVKVNPVLHFMEKDIWEYIKTNNVPYCELYDKGYRSIGCIPCTETPEDKGKEDKEEIIERLKSLGYF